MFLGGGGREEGPDRAGDIADSAGGVWPVPRTDYRLRWKDEKELAGAHLGTEYIARVISTDHVLKITNKYVRPTCFNPA